MVVYNNSDLGNRIGSHFDLAFTSDVSMLGVEPNFLQNAGTIGLLPVVNLPRVFNAFSDPTAITIYLTATTLFAISLVFNPISTCVNLYNTACFVYSNTPLWVVKSAIKLSLVETTIAASMGIIGRFNNKELMNRFYGNLKQPA